MLLWDEMETLLTSCAFSTLSHYLPYKTAQHNAVSSGLTPAPEDAAAAGGASESAGCLHFHLWLDQWDTVISWSQASGTCPDACWDSARAVGGVALGSFDTCFLVSWS